MKSALYDSCIYAIVLFMLTARPIEALPYAKACLLFVVWALRRSETYYRKYEKLPNIVIHACKILQ